MLRKVHFPLTFAMCKIRIDCSHKTNRPRRQTPATKPISSLCASAIAMEYCAELGSIVKEGDVVVLEGNTFDGPSWHLVRTIGRRSITFDVLSVLGPSNPLVRLVPALHCFGRPAPLPFLVRSLGGAARSGRRASSARKVRIRT
jgi:hypothetical protein